MKKVYISIPLASLLMFSGCASSMNQNAGKIGAGAIGTGIGVAVGKQVGGDSGAVLGGLIGLGIGLLIGDAIDERRAELKKIAEQENAVVTFNDIAVVDENSADNAEEVVGQSIEIYQESEQFESGKDTLNPKAKKMFEAMAKQFASSGQKVLIVGHTDSDGSDEYNQVLSEKRAKNIATLFKNNGVPIENMYYRGAGESQPMADNSSAQGKNKNRRVEIIEAPSEELLASYTFEKPTNKAFQKTASLKDNKKSANGKSLPKTTKDNLPKKTDSMAMPSIESPKIDSGASPSLETPNPTNIDNPMDAMANNQESARKNQDMQERGGEQKPQKDTPRQASSSPEKYQMQYFGNPKQGSLGSCSNSYYYTKNYSLDFKGKKTANNAKSEVVAMAGNPVKDRKLTLVTEAVANDGNMVFYSNCLNDSPESTGDIKSLETGEVVLRRSSQKHAPLLNGSTWFADTGGHYIGLHPVGVLINGMQPSTCPEVTITKKGEDSEWYGTSTKVLTYNGDGGILYRLYPQDTSKFVCMDIVYPHGNPQNAVAEIFYKSGSTHSSKTIKLQALNAK